MFLFRAEVARCINRGGNYTFDGDVVTSSGPNFNSLPPYASTPPSSFSCPPYTTNNDEPQVTNTLTPPPLTATTNNLTDLSNISGNTENLIRRFTLGTLKDLTHDEKTGREGLGQEGKETKETQNTTPQHASNKDITDTLPACGKLLLDSPACGKLLLDKVCCSEISAVEKTNLSSEDTPDEHNDSVKCDDSNSEKASCLKEKSLENSNSIDSLALVPFVGCFGANQSSLAKKSLW